MPNSAEPEVREVFFVSPIGADESEVRRRSDAVLKHIIRKSLGEGYRVTRADEEDAPDSITPRIIKRIQESYLIVVDITDHNPNVFYEMALAHGYRKPIIYLGQGDVRPPFDIKDLRIINYDLTDPDNLDTARERFSRASAHIETNSQEQHNPVADAQAFFELRESVASEGGSDAIANALEVISSDLRTLRHQVNDLRDERRTGSASSLERLPTDVLMRRVIELPPEHFRERLRAMFDDYRSESFELSQEAGKALVEELRELASIAPPDEAAAFGLAARRLEGRLRKARVLRRDHGTEGTTIVME